LFDILRSARLFEQELSWSGRSKIRKRGQTANSELDGLGEEKDQA
jgi:hypothetical protein